jgi:hypothetical protein
MIILVLRFRPEGLFRERPGLDRGTADQRSPDPAVTVPSGPAPAAEDGGPG